MATKVCYDVSFSFKLQKDSSLVALKTSIDSFLTKLGKQDTSENYCSSQEHEFIKKKRFTNTDCKGKPNHLKKAHGEEAAL